MADETKTWPKRIYLQHGDSPEVPPFDDVSATHDGVTWCQQKIEDFDVEYVRADIAIELFAALQAMVKQFNKTPSTLKDSGARCQAHAAIAAAETVFITPSIG